MVKTSKHKIETVAFPVEVLKADIDDGDCRKPQSCMIRVAVERTLRQMDGKPNHHTRVDAGHIRFHWNGRLVSADMPRQGKKALIDFDREAKTRVSAERRGEPFESKVKPFAMKVKGTLGPKVTKYTKARQEQVNEARRKREAAGQKPKRYTLRDRIVGFA